MQEGTKKGALSARPKRVRAERVPVSGPESAALSSVSVRSDVKPATTFAETYAV
jgi:hypothetical protein